MSEAFVTGLVRGMPLVVDTAPVRLWFTPALAYLLVRQNIDDDVGAAMRTAFDDQVALLGPPRFAVIDVHLATPIDSAAGRVRQAQWTKHNLGRIEQGIAYVGAAALTAFVARAVARVAGMPNVGVVVTEAEVADAVARFRRCEPLPTLGLRPRTSQGS